MWKLRTIVMNIRFEKVSAQHLKVIFEWLEEPNVKEFWDNSQAHKDDILNFVNGRKEPSSYANGQYIYWIGFIDETPYSLIMTIKENPGENRPQLKNDYISTTGTTYAMEFMIGNQAYFGKGLGARTLEEFIVFFQKNFDASADTFFIDPAVTNPRAQHVYAKAGFEHKGDILIEGNGVFAGIKAHFMVKKLNPKEIV